MSHRRMLGRVGSSTPVIPTPEAGVCTVYPIAIPVTTDLIHYSSPFNSCDIKQLNDGTSDITISGNRAAYWEDISGSGNELISNDTIPGNARGAVYIDNGSGDVYCEDKSSPLTDMSPNKSWRINTDVKTIIILARSEDVTNNVNSRIGFHFPNGVVRFNSSLLEYNGAGSSSLTIGSNTWFVLSVRVDNNVVLGIDKSYEEVTSSTPPVSNTDFTIWKGRSSGSGRWDGDIRDIAIYSESLSDADLDSMVDYMKNKWNL